jgi:Rrf2 family transcriptional regulator, iron-sulfur cluster assembly transcription factor
MVLSKSCHYGLRAVIYVARHSRDSNVPIHEITEQLNLSFHFVTKILQRLTQAGLLLSCQGPKGGVQLAKSSQEISLRDIVEAIEGPEIFNGCLLGLNMCRDDQPCPTHDEWAPLRDKLTHLFEKTTLAKLTSKSKIRELRLIDPER